MKLCEKLNTKKFVVTAELFPVKGVDTTDLMAKAEKIGHLVDGINITDNQRASMRLGSLAVSALLKQKGYQPIMQMTCRDRNRIALQSDLMSAYALGIENILILSGDHPSIGEYSDAKPVYDLDPVQLLSAAKLLESGIDLAGKKLKGAPSFCLGAVVNPTSTPLELQLISFEKKVAAGAQFFQTQTIFDVNGFKDFLNKTSHTPAKILAGVTLIKSLKFLEFLKALPGVNIPVETIERMQKAKNPLQEGIEICAQTITELSKFADGVHIMAIGAEELIPEILKRSKII